MIESSEIQNKATEFKISPHNVQKDYVYGLLLWGIYRNEYLKNMLVLKGGNALRKGYLRNTRFSKDLDFSTQTEVNVDALKESINKVLVSVHDATGVTFNLNQTSVQPKLVIDSRQVFEGKVKFQGLNNEETLTLKVQMDFTEFDNILLPTQERTLIHPYSDEKNCSINIKCHKLEEILAAKMVALLQRRKVGDLFDLVFAIFRNEYYQVNKKEVVTTFLRKTIYHTQPKIAQQQLIGLPMEESRPFWSEIIAPVSSLFAFDDAIGYFQNMINTFFEAIPTISPVRLGYGVSTVGSYQIGSYYPSSYRNSIISAGQSQTMIQLLYDGIWRMVEPYALKYYVRKKDNQGLEYFWGYDRTGGNSGKIGIKRFISDNIEDINPTSESFSPRWPIEL